MGHRIVLEDGNDRLDVETRYQTMTIQAYSSVLGGSVTIILEREGIIALREIPECADHGCVGESRGSRRVTHRQRVLVRRRRSKDHYRRWFHNTYRQVWYVESGTGRIRPIEDVLDGSPIRVGHVVGVLRRLSS